MNDIQFFLGSFHTGVLEPTPLTTTQNCSLSLDVLETSTMDIELSTGSLSEADRRDFEGYIGLKKKIVVAVTPGLAWDAPGKILFGGFVDKISVDVGKALAKVGVSSLSEYAAATRAAPAWAPVTNPKTKLEFAGENWEQVLAAIGRSLFSQQGVPADAPQIPNILGASPTPVGNAVKKEFLAGELKSYAQLLSEVRDADSDRGQEWQFQPRFTDSTMTAVVWDLVVGTSANPQINYNNTITVNLDEETTVKPSAASTMLDSSNYFSRLWTQSKNGSGEEGMDLAPYYKPGTQDTILFDSYQSFNEELTPAQMQEQVNSRMLDADATGRSFTLTTEEADFAEWYNRLGSRLVITGNTEITAGHAGHFRLLAIAFTAGKGSVSLTVAQHQRTYPKLPRNRIKNIGGGRKGGANIQSTPMLSQYPPGSFGGGSGGGGTPPPMPPMPWEPGNPEDPADGGPGAGWGMNAGGNIGTEPVLNDRAPTATFHQSGSTVWGPGFGGFTPQSNGVVLGESNILHALKGFGRGGVRHYTWAESPVIPVGLGLGQTTNSQVFASYLSEGEVRGQKLVHDAPIFTDLNIQDLLTGAAESDMWVRPPAFEFALGSNISYYSVYSIHIAPRADCAISSGGKIIVPVNVSIVWWRDNATQNGAAPTGWGNYSNAVHNDFTSFVYAEYFGVDSISQNWRYLPEFGVPGLLNKMGRVGSFGLFTTQPVGALRSINFGATSGLDENQWVFPAAPSSVGAQFSQFEFGHWGGEEYRVLAWHPITTSEVYSIPVAGGTAPVPNSTSWESTGVNAVTYQGLGTAFNAKPIVFIDTWVGSLGALLPGGLVDIAGGGDTSNRAYSNAIFCYRNYIYLFGTGQGYRSYQLSYAPQ